jgi:hypothetical protein
MEERFEKGKMPLNTVNCYDQSAAVQAFCACLGVNVTGIYQDPFGYIKTTKLVGVGDCNNPFYKSKRKKPPVDPRRVVLDDPPVPDDDSKPKRTGFGNHAFIENKNAGAHIRDACAGPHTGEEDLRNYLESSIDLDYEGLLILGRRPTPEEKKSAFDRLMTKAARTMGIRKVS